MWRKRCNRNARLVRGEYFRPSRPPLQQTRPSGLVDDGLTITDAFIQKFDGHSKRSFIAAVHNHPRPHAARLLYYVEMDAARQNNSSPRTDWTLVEIMYMTGIGIGMKLWECQYIGFNPYKFSNIIWVHILLSVIIIITRKCTLWRCKSTPTPKAKLLWMTSHYGPTVVRSVTEIPFHVFI